MKKLTLLFLIAGLFTINTFSQWTFVGGAVGIGTFPSISVASPTVVWLFGGPTGTPKVFLSINGGTTFTDVSGNLPAGKELFCGWGVDATTAYAGDGGASGGAGGDAKMYKTTNAGVTWTQILNTGGSAGFFNSIVFSRITPLFGVAQSDPPNGAGQPYFVRTTTDGGTTWVTVTCPGVSGQASSQNGLAVIDATFYGFGLGNNAPPRAVITTNGGTSWTTVTLGTIAGGFISGFAFSDDKLRGVAGSNTSLPNIARTTNVTSWSNVNIGTGVTGYCVLKWVHTTNYVLCSGQTGAGGVVKESLDGGVTWALMTTAGITGLTHMDYVFNAGICTAFAVAGDGSVIRLIKNLVGINPINNEVPTGYNLAQNYPNPFNPSTTINYSIPKSSNVAIKIYDALGNEVKTVVNEFHPAGNYSASVDASNLASGVYYYTIAADGFNATKKMTLIK